MITLKRDKKICNGLKSCGICTGFIKEMANGPVHMRPWAYEHNEQLITDMILACPAGAIEVELP